MRIFLSSLPNSFIRNFCQLWISSQSSLSNIRPQVNIYQIIKKKRDSLSELCFWTSVNECFHTVRPWPAVLQAIQYPKGWFIIAKVLERDLHPLGPGELSLQPVCNHKIILGWKGPGDVSVLSMFSIKHRLSLLRAFLLNLKTPRDRDPTVKSSCSHQQKPKWEQQRYLTQNSTKFPGT